MPDQPLHDYRHSRAVLIGTWDYDILPSVPPVRHSLDRMTALLTSNLCGWPTDRLTILRNKQGPGDLPDRLVALFEGITDVALFYYVGHGQIDDDERLCLGLKGSRAESHRRATTSLPFETVRAALFRSRAATKIVILDCCFSGLATDRSHTLADDPVELLDKAAGAGAYTMAASSSDRTAWLETDSRLARPQTYFTRYLADLVETGIPGQPAELRLRGLFTQVKDNLTRDGKPVPQDRNVDAAHDFVFARNAAPAPTHRDPDQETRRLTQLLARAEAREQELQAKATALAHELDRLHERARRDEPMPAAQKQELNDAIRTTERRLVEAKTAEAKTATLHRVSAPGAVPRPPAAPAGPRTAPGRPAASRPPASRPPRPARRVRLLAFSAVVALVVAGTVTAVILTNPPDHNSGGPSLQSSSPPASHSPHQSASGPATATAAGKVTGCLVTDSGGINDRGFDALSWQGLQEAAQADTKASVKYRASTTQSDYIPNLGASINDKCDIIVTVGFLMGDDTKITARANPGQKFAIVDFSYSPALSNVDALLFNTVQDAFLGGYLAAGMTKTGRVATFGGQKLPTVTIYLDGFYDGVQYYNSTHRTHVQVLGWNEQTQNGSFSGDFTNETKGETLAQAFISEGADIIFPVAGNAGLGAAKAVKDADEAAGSQRVNLMWPDTDGCFSVPQYCQYFITSVQKVIATAVKNAVLGTAAGSFRGGNYVGTLANGGVALAPFHDFDSKVPAALKNELRQVQQGIENGSIHTPTKSSV